MYKGIQSSMWENSLRSIFLLLSFPILLWIFVVIALRFVFSQDGQQLSMAESLLLANDVFLVLGPIILVWGIISFFFHRQMIFAFAGAKPITRKEVPELYNIVENLCISR